MSVYFLLLENVCVSELRLNIVLNPSTARNLRFSRSADVRPALEAECFGRVLKGDHTYVTLDDKAALKGVMTITTINTPALSESELCRDREERTENTCVKYQPSKTLTLNRAQKRKHIFPQTQEFVADPVATHHTHTTPHFITRYIHLPWVRAVPVDAVSLRGGEPSTDAQRHTHQTHQIHISSSRRESDYLQLGLIN